MRGVGAVVLASTCCSLCIISVVNGCMSGFCSCQFDGQTGRFFSVLLLSLTEILRKDRIVKEKALFGAACVDERRLKGCAIPAQTALRLAA